MIDPTSVSQFFTFANLSALFVKSFGVILSFMYLILAIVISRQVAVMNRTLMSSIGFLLRIVAWIQIAFGVILVLMALFLI